MTSEGASEIARIGNELRRSFDGPAWHGPAVKELLAGVTAEAAAARPLPNAHTIWELVLHIACWEDAARRLLAGEAFEPTDEQDWPVPRGAWESALAELGAVHNRLLEAAAAFPEERLDANVPGRDFSYYFLLHGVVSHNLYHGGQIAILKKQSR